MLYDEIIFEPNNEFEIVYKNTKELEIGKIIKKTVNVFKNYFVFDIIPAKIIINKRIPINYGLGSRISTAMTIIKGLAEFLKIELSFGDLNDILLIINPELEFLNTEKNAVLIQNGEIIQYLNIQNPYSTIIVFPKINYSFKTFESIIKKYRIKQEFNTSIKKINSENVILNPDLFLPNNVENILIAEYPELKNIKLILEKDSVFSSLNNKGSSFFGFYDNIEKLRATVNQLKSMGYHTEAY